MQNENQSLNNKPGEKNQTDQNTQMSDFDKKGFFDKRIGRKIYWIYAIVWLIPLGVLYGTSLIADITDIVYYIILVLLVITLTLISIWRLNDIGRPKWFIIGLFIPFLNCLILYDLGFTKGRLHRLLTDTKLQRLENK